MYSSPNIRIKRLLKPLDSLYKQWMYTDIKLVICCSFSHSLCECTIIVTEEKRGRLGAATSIISGSGLLYRRGHNNMQLFALIAMRGSALLNVRDAFLISGKCCIYILVSGTRYSYVKVTGAQSWLQFVTSPVAFPLG